MFGSPFLSSCFLNRQQHHPKHTVTDKKYIEKRLDWTVNCAIKLCWIFKIEREEWYIPWDNSLLYLKTDLYLLLKDANYPLRSKKSCSLKRDRTFLSQRDKETINLTFLTKNISRKKEKVFPYYVWRGVRILQNISP